MNVQIEQWELYVDKQQTKDLYAQQPYQNDNIFGLNYIEVCSFCEPQILNFFDALGVDILKPTALHYLPVEGDCIMYSGCYHVIGERLKGELDEWDILVEQFCFALTADQYDKPEQLTTQWIEISFEVVLPWMLFEAIPTV